MANSAWHVYGSVFVYFFVCFLCQSVKTQDSRAYLERPTISADYKVDIDSGGVDCYYQHVVSGATFFFSATVIRGGDGLVGVAIQHSNGSMVYNHVVEASSHFTDHFSAEGYYIMCLDNPSTFSNRLVSIYVHVVKHKEWEAYAKEIQELHLNIQNFTAILNTVERDVDLIGQFQSDTRNRESRDMALLLDNNSYVQNRSILLIVVIILTCSVQVYFIIKCFAYTGYAVIYFFINIFFLYKMLLIIDTTGEHSNRHYQNAEKI